MKKIAALIVAALLVSVPVMAQTGPETPPPGTVIVMAGMYDGVDIIPVEEYIIIPPMACDPS